jgi:hypothetical protein
MKSEIARRILIAGCEDRVALDIAHFRRLRDRYLALVAELIADARGLDEQVIGLWQAVEKRVD